jgi:hypothetical protein
MVTSTLINDWNDSFSYNIEHTLLIVEKPLTIVDKMWRPEQTPL